MADFNNTVSISYRADIKDLLAQLKKMPNISEEEARKMVKGIDRQFKQMEKSYQKAAKNGVASMNRVIKSQKAATLSARSLRKEAANLDRLTGELSVGLGLVNDDMAMIAQTASAAASGAEGLARAMMAMNPVGLALIGTITAIGGAYLLFSHNTDKLDEATQKFQATLQNNAKEMERLEQIADKASQSFGTITSSTNNLRNEILVLRGELSEVDLAEMGIEQKVFETVQKLTNERDKQVEALILQRSTLLDTEKAIERQRTALERQKNALFGVGVEQGAITGKTQHLLRVTGQRQEIEEQIRKVIKDTNVNIFKQGRETEKLLKEKIEIEKAEKRSNDLAKRRQEDLKAFIKQVKQEQKELAQIAALSKQTSEDFLKVQSQIQSIEDQRLKDELKRLDINIQSLKKQGEFVKHGAVIESLQRKQVIQQMQLEQLYSEQNQALEDQKALNESRSTEANQIVTAAQAEFDKLKEIAETKEQLAELAKLELSLQEAKEQAQSIEAQNVESLKHLEVAQYKTREDLERKLHELKMNFNATEQAANEAALKAFTKGAAFTFQQMQNLASAVMNANNQIQQNNLKAIEQNRDRALSEIDDLEKRGSISEKEAAKRREEMEERYADTVQQKQVEIFYSQQSAARSRVLIEAAVAAARAFSDYPFPVSLGISALAAAGAAAQLKAINSAPPPQFDIGGMIGSTDPMAPDQRTARVLEGEAILDRATVQRIGGEQGVRRLQRDGASSSGVVVIQPFKHFDRFIKGARRRGAFGMTATGRGSY